MGKVLDLSNVSMELAKVRNQKKIVFTNGCFDLLHVGHIRYLKEAKALGDILFIGVNSDSSVRKLKGPSRPIQLEHDRAEILASLACVDYVCLFSEDTPYELIKCVQPEILVKGGDWNVSQIAGSDLVLAKGGKVYSLQFVNGYSTTTLIARSQME